MSARVFHLKQLLDGHFLEAPSGDVAVLAIGKVAADQQAARPEDWSRCIVFGNVHFRQ